MRWFPGGSVPAVEEVTEFGMTYGQCSIGRMWAGDDVEVGGNGGLQTINKGPAHDACEAELARRQADAGSF